MPPAVTFTRADVLRAAVALAEKRGVQTLTARSVAQRLKASVAPVYRHFPSMDVLRRSVVQHAADLLLEYTRHPYTDRPFLNQGTGIVLFARDHRRLFRSMFLEGNQFRDVIEEGLATVRDEMTRDPRFTGFSVGEREALLTKMWFFTLGLATQICVGLTKDESQESVIQALMDVGTIVIPAAIAESQVRRAISGDTRE